MANTGETLNAATSSHESYLVSQEFRMIKIFLYDIEFYQHGNFFTDDILSDVSLMKTLASASFGWNTFSTLSKPYSSQSKHNRNSTLKSDLQEIDAKCSELVGILRDLCNLKTHPTMKAALLSEMYLKKAEKPRNRFFLS